MSKKPLDAGLKRSFKIIGAVMGVSVVAITAVSLMGNDNDADQQQSQQSSIGRVPTGSQINDPQLSEATRQRLDRVQKTEAAQARNANRSYIPEIMITGGEPIQIEVQEELSPSDAPPPRRAAESFATQRNAVAQAQPATAPEIPPGMQRQLIAILAGLGPATVQEISISPPLERAPIAQAQASASNVAITNQNAASSEMIINADDIVGALLLTPIDTYRSTFVMAQIAGGKLNGAQLRGQVIPMNFSGDVEDVGIRFSSMNWNGNHYPINAIALSEQDSTDALNGDVDRRVFHRQVMPILMAGLSGVSTYFTARGTPSTSIATGVSSGDTAIIVDQDKASREEATQQGIGNAIDKAVQQGQQQVDRARSQPNQVTLPAFTPIGVIFNAPVMANK